ncbi:hypothetical protein BZG36_03162 [Bifiguratus adelaidae]|uniref:Hemerythrin-like domain-containing protein n=1 Tax=Bifiguratus adelaidae TaxID=1938954 RepID=A0A261Y135_9FUNG|nr:hypothetical protein BZG36_03162 [Bifiguratus adelaidae]
MTNKTSDKSIIDLVIDDHEEVRSLWKQYQSEPDQKAKGDIKDKVVYNVAVHSHAEELVLYAAFEAFMGAKGKELADISRAEHREIKKEYYRLDRLKHTDPNLESEMQRAYDEFNHHAKHEENEILPEFSKSVNEDQLKSLGGAFTMIKTTVPTRPHPSAPDTPGLEALFGTAVAPVDWLRDLFRSLGK